MIKVPPKQFNIFAFVIKAVIALFSIAISFLMFYFFEQKGMVVQLQLVQPKTEINFSNLSVNFNEKELERFISSVLCYVVLTRKPIIRLCSIFAKVSITALIVLCVLIAIKTKKENKKVCSNKNERVNRLIKNEPTHFYDFIKKLNLTLTI